MKKMPLSLKVFLALGVLGAIAQLAVGSIFGCVLTLMFYGLVLKGPAFFRIIAVGLSVCGIILAFISLLAVPSPEIIAAYSLTIVSNAFSVYVLTSSAVVSYLSGSSFLDPDLVAMN